MISLETLYENEEIIVINKPAGLAVQGGKGITHSVDTILPQQQGYPIYLVHRLDKETAGILVVAKNPKAANLWTNILSSENTIKEYNALCYGIPAKNTGIFSDVIVQKGTEKKAITHYTLLRQFKTSEGNFSLLSLKIDTGRMHQIRIHLAKNNLPILGDDKHGNFALNKMVKKNLGIKKLMLAAITLTIPIQKKKTTFSLEKPEHFIKAIEAIENIVHKE
ncbi:MAG: RluA family pseudouridine synthase [Spirochaetaceae bacterium]|nr:RluA family pseudouridine synthase [Spirochaetaceae bacterium]